jgi:hemerythrin-like metal-binding protein
VVLLKHFEDEENLMRRIGFPFLDAHIEEHEKIIKVLDGVCEIFLKSSDYNKECFTPVYSVMHSHLDQMDFQIVPYYQKWVKENEGSS